MILKDVEAPFLDFHSATQLCEVISEGHTHRSHLQGSYMGMGVIQTYLDRPIKYTFC